MDSDPHSLGQRIAGLRHAACAVACPEPAAAEGQPRLATEMKFPVRG